MLKGKQLSYLKSLANGLSTMAQIVLLTLTLASLVLFFPLAGTGCAATGNRTPVDAAKANGATHQPGNDTVQVSEGPVRVRDEAVNALAEAIKTHARKGDTRFLLIDVTAQRIFLLRGTTIEASYPVSTSKYGAGSREGSNMTPLGVHRICGKYGAGAPVGTIFKARQSTGEFARIFTDDTDSENDHVMTRVIRLTGIEPGKNSGKGVDSKKRCIYIHGTPEEGLIGRPASHGCVRMKNRDCAALFDSIFDGDLVVIVP